MPGIVEQHSVTPKTISKTTKKGKVAGLKPEDRVEYRALTEDELMKLAALSGPDIAKRIGYSTAFCLMQYMLCSYRITHEDTTLPETKWVRKWDWERMTGEPEYVNRPNERRVGDVRLNRFRVVSINGGIPFIEVECATYKNIGHVYFDAFNSPRPSNTIALYTKTPNKIVKMPLSKYAAKYLGVAPGDSYKIDALQTQIVGTLDTDAWTFELVRGEGIYDCYLNEIGGYSCMTGSRAECVEMYCKNPDTVALLIAKRKDGEIVARSIIWTLEDGVWFDRVYSKGACTNREIATAVIRAYLMNRFADRRVRWAYNSDPQGETLPVIRLKLGPKRFIPYLDSFCYGVLHEDQRSVWLFGAIKQWEEFSLKNVVPVDDGMIATLNDPGRGSYGGPWKMAALEGDYA